VVRDQVDQHVDEEEGTLFPAAHRTLAERDLLEMGEEMEALYADLMEGERGAHVPSEPEWPSPP
jgi:hypothetical protein